MGKTHIDKVRKSRIYQKEILPILLEIFPLLARPRLNRLQKEKILVFVNAAHAIYRSAFRLQPEWQEFARIVQEEFLARNPSLSPPIQILDRLLVIHRTMQLVPQQRQKPIQIKSEADWLRQITPQIIARWENKSDDDDDDEPMHPPRLGGGGSRRTTIISSLTSFFSPYKNKKRSLNKDRSASSGSKPEGSSEKKHRSN